MVRSRHLGHEARAPYVARPCRAPIREVSAALSSCPARDDRSRTVTAMRHPYYMKSEANGTMQSIPAPHGRSRLQFPEGVTQNLNLQLPERPPTLPIGTRVTPRACTCETTQQVKDFVQGETFGALRTFMHHEQQTHTFHRLERDTYGLRSRVCAYSAVERSKSSAARERGRDSEDRGARRANATRRGYRHSAKASSDANCCIGAKQRHPTSKPV